MFCLEYLHRSAGKGMLRKGALAVIGGQLMLIGMAQTGWILYGFFPADGFDLLLIALESSVGIAMEQEGKAYMRKGFLRYSLAEGYIDHWLLAGPHGLVVKELDRFGDPPEKHRIAQAYHSPEAGISGDPIAYGDYQAGEAAGKWRYARSPRDHQIDLSALHPLTEYLRAWAYAEIDGPACSSHGKDSDERFRCAADEYGEILKLAYQATHAANPDSKVLSFSFNFGDFLDANPAGFPDTPSFARNRLAFLDQVFRESPEYFDAIALQCNYDYPGIPRSFESIRNTYRLGKPMLCTDAASNPMIGLQQAQPGDRYEDLYPFLTDNRILEILGGGSTASKYGEVNSWWEAEKASLSVKKAVVAADAGAVQISFQFVMTGWGGKDYVWTHSELLSAGPEYGDEEPVGTPRPVVYALGQLGERIADFHSVKNMNPIPPGTDPRSWIWIYRFAGREGFIYVIWSGSGERIVDLSAFSGNPDVRVTRLVTSLDGDNRPVYPEEEIRPSDSIPVNEIPMFVQ
jgi:hypothetical protein